MRKFVGKNYGSAVESDAERDALFPEEIPTKHGSGRFCTKCGKKKDTKKVGKIFLCKKCKDAKDV
jgi:NADH pyrophosphatase NudC (nudix superfamily)